MKVSYEWLQTYFDDALPNPQELGELLTFHAFEIEGIEQVEKDHTIDIDVLPNRASDCLCHRGIAREIATLLNKKLKADPLLREVLNTPVSKLLTVDVENPELCNRFSAVVIEGVKVGPSPKWLVKRLRAIGQKPINNVVDAVNYVMFDIGQPLHAFDRDKFISKSGGCNITVRTGKKGEKIKVLTGEMYDVGIRDLLITDGNSHQAIGIAGIKGGKHAEVDKNTVNLIIEAANFNYVSVRKTSQRLKLITEASSRFQNEPSPELTLHALREVGRILQDINVGGKIEGYVDVYPKKKKPYKVGVSLLEVNKLLGTKMSEKEVKDIFERFSFTYEKVKPREKILEIAKELLGKPYRYGASISYDAPDEFDCSSFASYVFAQAGVAIPRMSVDQFTFGNEVKEKELQPGDLVFSVGNDKNKIHQESVEFLKGAKIKGGISHCGIYVGEGKIIHASGEDSGGKVIIEKLIESADFKNIVGYRRMLPDDEERFVVTAPFERKDLKIKEDLIEEIGRVYGYENIKSEPLPKVSKRPDVSKQFYYAEKVRRLLIEQGFSEVITYVLRDKGEIEIENPLASDKAFLRSDLADEINNALELNKKNAPLLGLKDIRIFEIGKVFKKGGEYTALCIGQENKAKPRLDEIKNILGRVLGVILDGEKNEQTIEFDFDKILDKLSEPKTYDTPVYWSKEVKFQPISLYPFVLRDISVWVPETVKSEDVVMLIRKEAGSMLVNSQLFDEYKKGDKVSYAFNLVFQSREKTLSDAEVNQIMESVIGVLNKRPDFEVR